MENKLIYFSIGESFMRKFLAIISFIPMFLFFYLFRIVFYDIILNIIHFLFHLITLHFLTAFLDLLSLLLTPLDAIIGLFVCFVCAIDSSREIWIGEWSTATLFDKAKDKRIL